MKSVLIVAIAALLVISIERAQSAEPQAETTLSLNLADVSLLETLEQISRASGAIFVVHPEVKNLKGPDLRFENVPFSDALRIVFSAHRVCSKTTGNVTRITPAVESQGQLICGSCELERRAVNAGETRTLPATRSTLLPLRHEFIDAP